MGKNRRDPLGRTLKKGESYRKADKMYVYSWTDPVTKKRMPPLYSKDLLKLREKVAKLQATINAGLDVFGNRKETVNSMFDRYLATKTELRPNTRSGYIYTYDTYVRDSFGMKKIADVRYSDIMYFYTSLIEKNGLSVSTVEHVQTVLHPTFEMAVRDQIISNNPSSKVMGELKKKKNGTHPGIKRALSLEHQRAFLKFLDEENQIRWRPLFTVLFGTGCRIGEVIGLRWQDVDMENRVIEINHTVTYGPDYEFSKKCVYRYSDPKTVAGVRTIPMFEEVYNALLEEKEMQERLGISCTQVLEGHDGFIFTNRMGNIHKPHALNKVIKRIVSDYNALEIGRAEREGREPDLLPAFSCHITRHSFCSRLCESDTNIKVIQSVMGHDDIQTTLDIYAEVTERKKKNAFADLAEKVELF